MFSVSVHNAGSYYIRDQLLIVLQHANKCMHALLNYCPK